MSTICKTTRENMVIEVCCNIFTYYATTKLNITTSNTLCKCYNIRLNIKVFKCKHLTSSAPASHNFITNHKDTKFITNLSNTWKITLRWNNNTVRTSNCFHNNCSNIIRVFVNNLFSKLC